MTGFMAACLAVLASELGDRTFIVTTILAMKHSKTSVFLGAMAAAALMISISGLIGASSSILPKAWIHYLSVALFLFFGLQMLLEAYSMTPLGEEGDDTSVQLPNGGTEKKKITNEIYTENHTSCKSSPATFTSIPAEAQSFLVSGVFVSTFTMNFFAEWGDKSQISVILLAAKENLLMVLGGALVGHLVANSLAVLGGAFIRDIISVRTVTFVGGITFIGFAILSLIS